MKKKNILYIATLIAFLVVGFSSCVEDEGSYEMSDINEVKISGIEEEYNLISFQETLNITPEIECTQKGISEDDLEYKWFVCTGSLSGSEADHKHVVIGTERNLSYKVDVAPGNYLIYFQVKDKHTGLKFEQYFSLKAISSFVRGFYLYGDKADGTVGIDFVSMPTGRDTILVKDIFVNSQKIKGAKDLIFTGHYNNGYNALWAITDDYQYKVEYSAQLEKVDIIPDENLENIIFPTMEAVQRPFHLTNISPGTYGPTCISLSRSTRVIITENEIYAASIIMSEAYGNPINRDTSSPTAALFKPYPYAFYSAASTSVGYVFFFDMTNHCFKKPVGSSLLGSTSYCERPNDSETPFYLDQNKYNPIRQMVYAENGYGNAGRSYALMNDENGDYYVYGFRAPANYKSDPTKEFATQIDLSVATDFEKASHYAFFSMQSVLLYSVGSKLYAYDYDRKVCKLIEDYGRRSNLFGYGTLFNIDSN